MRALALVTRAAARQILRFHRCARKLPLFSPASSKAATCKAHRQRRPTVAFEARILPRKILDHMRSVVCAAIVDLALFDCELTSADCFMQSAVFVCSSIVNLLGCRNGQLHSMTNFMRRSLIIFALPAGCVAHSSARLVSLVYSQNGCDERRPNSQRARGLRVYFFLAEFSCCGRLRTSPRL